MGERTLNIITGTVLLVCILVLLLCEIGYDTSYLVIQKITKETKKHALTNNEIQPLSSSCYIQLGQTEFISLYNHELEETFYIRQESWKQARLVQISRNKTTNKSHYSRIKGHLPSKRLTREDLITQGYLNPKSHHGTEDHMYNDVEDLQISSYEAVQLLNDLDDQINRFKEKLRGLDLQSPLGDDKGGIEEEERMEIEMAKDEIVDTVNTQFTVKIKDPESITKSHWTMTTGVQNMKPPVFLDNVSNPCFVEEEEESTITTSPRVVARSCERLRSMYPGNNTRKVISAVSVRAVSEGGEVFSGSFRLRCLPAFYLLGFPKCGTTDIWMRLRFHRLVKDAVCKEPQFWDRRRFQRGVRFSDYLDLFNFGAQRIIKSEENGQMKMILGDFSTRTIGNDYYWAKYEGNNGLQEPLHLIANEIHHLTPNAKFIVCMRNPTDRLFSDYMHFRHISVEEFHLQVVVSIAWWTHCMHKHSFRSCLYGQPTDMALLEIPGHYWDQNVTAQIRTGMYAAYIKDWLAVFPKDQLLFVEFRDYIKEEATFISENILPFLNIGPFTEKELRIADRVKKSNTRQTHTSKRVEMYPETRKLLDNFYAPFNQELATLLNDDKYLWHT